MRGCLLWVAIFLLWSYDSSQKECKEPDDIDFGEIISDEKARYLENDRVQYECNSGYVLDGSEWILCNGQEWTPPPPKCLAPCSITKQQLATKKLFLLGGRRRNQVIQSNRTLQFWCSEGYVLSGSSARKCVDGHMDLPFCISEHGQNCSGPPKTENGDIITSSEKQYRSGSSVEFKCQQYYAMKGQNRSFCDDGNWTKVPTCLDPCRIPRAEMESHNIEVKGTVHESENIYIQRGDFIELTCKTGFSLVRNPSQSAFKFHCDGALPGIPQCKARGCDYIHIKHGKMSQYYEYWKPFPRREGQTIEYGCHSGYLAANRDKWQRATCTKFGFDPEPKCFKTCDPSFRFHHGHFIYDYRSKFIEGDNITFSCDEGYYPAGPQPTARCTEDGWSSTPRCVQTDSTCPEPPKVENAEIIEDRKEKYLSGQEMNYQCNDGFEISGSPTVTCVGKKWSRLPRCEDVTCSSPPKIHNGLANGQIKERYLPLEKVSYRCHQRYSLIGPPLITCMKKRWTETPRCIDAGGKCGRPPPMENGDIIETPKAEYMQGERVTYQCQNLYRMEGSPRVFCQNGHWSEIPTCTVPCTASEEDMRRHNIQLMWKWDTKIYSEAGDEIEFTCRRGFYPDPHSRPFRAHCIEGKLDYPNCIRE